MRNIDTYCVGKPLISSTHLEHCISALDILYTPAHNSYSITLEASMKITIIIKSVQYYVEKYWGGQGVFSFILTKFNCKFYVQKGNFIKRCNANFPSKSSACKWFLQASGFSEFYTLREFCRDLNKWKLLHYPILHEAAVNWDKQ